LLSGCSYPDTSWLVPVPPIFESALNGYLSSMSPVSQSDGLSNTPLAKASPNGRHTSALRVAAAGDVHCREPLRAELEEAFARLEGTVDLVLLAGDLTTHGDPEEAAVLVECCRGLSAPKIAVLGNHDWHAGRHDELVRLLVEGGISVLERSSTVCEINGLEVGVVGTKGFIGGFPGSHLPDFGEPLLREVYAETSAEVEALDRGLRAVAHCSVRIVLLHYAPTEATLVGEPEGIWVFLGTDRMAPPIIEHCPDLVLHGHAHAGQFEGTIGEVPVFNVSVPVIGRDFWIVELSGVEKRLTPIH
jgi:Icc-related predicted phosphoesterase